VPLFVIFINLKICMGYGVQKGEVSIGFILNVTKTMMLMDG
jgi:hypothetical protein